MAASDLFKTPYFPDHFSPELRRQIEEHAAIIAENRRDRDKWERIMDTPIDPARWRAACKQA